MSEDKLTQIQEAAALLIAEGELDKKAIAEKLKISRQSLYNWMKNENFKSRVDTLLQDFESLGKELIATKFIHAVEEYWDLIQNTKNDRVKAEGYRYYIDRKLGKPTGRVDVGINNQDNNGVDEDIIEAEFDRIANEYDEEE
ncbi:phBC6A51 family helix-turn-helix protein [Bacillus litorisediminis]|uniref:phBC6A51 family helix-turn-helix protein n=1 Tax=Bacillus litorisediminis TaxID=2922713 RepID=UPI001FAF1D1C|nr:phBC6A51 family helix-turn-helix protein [Bacillus litorisediminis]